MTLKYKNNAQTTLSAGINDSVTSIAVVDGSVFPALTGIEYFYMTLEDVSLNREVVKVTARSGNTLTVVRAQDGSVARAFSIGDKAEGRLVAAMLADLSAPSYILAALLTVDGTGSTLDADLLDGQSSAYYLAAGSYTAADVLSKLLTVDGAGSGLDADLLDGQSSAYYLAAGSYTAADVLSKLLTVDGAGSGLDADTVDTYHVGTSGATIPLLSGANTWSTTQTFSSDISTGTTSKVTLGTDGNIEIFRSGGGAFIDFKNSAGDDFDVRISQNGANGLYLSAPDGVLLNGAAIPTISSTDTLSNKTLSSPTLSGTVAGSPTFSGNPVVSGGTFTSTYLAQSGGNSTYITQYNTAAGADEKRWYWLLNGGNLILRAVNDAFSADADALSFTRSGYTPVTANFATTNLQHGGVKVPTISSTDTLSNKTLSSPTLSGTVAGSPGWASAQTFPTLTKVGAGAAPSDFIINGLGSGTSGGARLTLQHGGTFYAAIGTRSSIYGGAFDNKFNVYATTDLELHSDTSVLTFNGTAIPTISSTDTLSNKTLSSPTVSGTIAGAATWTGTQTFNASQSFNGASGVGAIKVLGAGGSWFWIDNPSSTVLRFSSGAAPGTNSMTYTDAGVLAVAGSITAGGNTVWHAGNDGAGSGLDADLLDGYSSASFVFQNQSYTAASITFTGIGGNSGNGNADYHIYQEAGAWTHPYPDLIFAYHTGIKIMSTTGYGGTKFYGATPSYIGATDPLFIVGNIDNATSHISHPVTSPTTDGFGLEFLINGTYADGRYAHRLAKYDAGGGVPLYMQKTSGTAGAWTTIARFGSFSGNDREFEVFGRTAVTAGDNSYTTYGPNTSYAAYLHVGSGNPPSRATKNASIIATDGNLHIDSGGAQQIYLNYYVDQPIYAWRQILYQGAHTFWHAANDGSGSGLDADLLDGYNVGTSGAAIGLLNAAWTRGNTTTFSQGYGVNFANSGATHGIFDYNNTTLILAYNTGDWTSSVRISSGNTQIYAGGNAMTYDGSTLTVSAGNITASADGVHRFGSGSDTASMSGTSPLLYVNGLYATGIAAKRTGSYAEVGMQSGSRAYLGSYNAYEVNFVRNNVAVLEMNATNLLHLATGGTYWHSGNDGAGSGLDADTVDGVHIHQLLYATDTSGYNWGSSINVSNMNAALGTTSGTQRCGFFTASAPTNSPNGDWVHWINHVGSQWPTEDRYGFQIAHGFWNNNMWVRRVTDDTWGSWTKMWNADNDGSGSGLDADLLDGYNADINANASTVAVRSSAGDLYVSSIYASNWFRSTGVSGWYSQTYGGGIFMEDTTYVKVYGGKAFYVPNSIDATGNITAYYSDERLKTKTRNVENALDQVSSLTPFFYVENETARSLGYNNLKEQVGLSAQEVQRILPQVVHRAPVDIAVDENGNKYSKSGEDYLTVDYARVVPLLVAAIKELRAEVTELKRAA